MELNKSKAQSSIEFLIITAILLVVFIIMGFVIHQKYTELSDLTQYMEGRQITNTLSDSINQITIVGEGYSQSITLYVKYNLDEFNISFYRKEPTIFVENQENKMTWGAPILTTKVSCCLDICEMDEYKTIMHLNQTLTTKVINYNDTIFIGKICS